jgi:hypothetical protein
VTSVKIRGCLITVNSSELSSEAESRSFRRVVLVGFLNSNAPELIYRHVKFEDLHDLTVFHIVPRTSYSMGSWFDRLKNAFGGIRREDSARAGSCRARKRKPLVYPREY